MLDAPPGSARGITRSDLRLPADLSLTLTADNLSRLLHVDKTTLSKWENNDDPVGTQSDLAIRLIVMSLDKGLKKKLQKVVEEQFEKIQFLTAHRSKKFAPQKAAIHVDASDLSYVYA